MEIRKTVQGSTLNIALEGRLDTTTAPQLEEELKRSWDGVTELILDFQALDYLSSAGLRVILAAQKVMNRQGRMVVRHVNESIMEVFELTGFVDILTIEYRFGTPAPRSSAQRGAPGRLFVHGKVLCYLTERSGVERN